MKSRGKKKMIWLKVLGGLVLLGILVYLGLIGLVVLQEKRVSTSAADLPEDYDAIVVLGAQILQTGEPNTQLAWRLDAALEAWRKHQVPIVTCGAQGSDEPMPEAIAMRDYLMKHGVAEELIRMDTTSFNTKQNLQNAGKLLKEMTGIRKVLIVSSDYHVPRAMMLARDQGYEAIGLGSPCKPEYWIKNHAREALAWVKYYLDRILHSDLLGDRMVL